MICNICPRKCNINRDEKTGFCQSPAEFRIARAALHYWEEPYISGKSGSGAVFFSGCNLKCVFCQNYEISSENKGVLVSEDRLIEIFENLVENGAENINLVNPTHYAPMIASVLKRWKSPVPIVYNSSGYESVKTLKMLDGLIDIYLPDFKYINSEKAKRYSKAGDYPTVVKACIAEMKRQAPDYVFDGEMMKKGVIIRHLILPQNTNSSLKIIDYIAENYPDTYLSLMAQYTPCNDLSAYTEINRKITAREYKKVVDYALDRGLERVFVQEMDSASQQYIPPFNFEGVI